MDRDISWIMVIPITLFLFLSLYNTIYGQNGTLDKKFGNEGVVILNKDSLFGIDNPGSVRNMIVQPDYKILINFNKTLVRLNPDGSVDNTFGMNGIFNPDFNHELDWINSIAFSKPDKISLTGQVIDGQTGDLFVMRLDNDGTRDIEFGNEGMKIFHFEEEGSWEEGYNILGLPDGKILVNGLSFIIKYNEDGSIDTSFGVNGISLVLPGLDAAGFSMTTQKDNKIILAGTYVERDSLENYNQNLAFFRLNENGTRDISFGNDGLVQMDATFPNDSILEIDYPKSQDLLVSMGVLSDGSIVASGRKFYRTDQNLLNLSFSTIYDTYEMILVKLNPDGSPDLNFGVNGIIEGPISFESSMHLNYPLIIQTDDKILVGHAPQANLSEDMNDLSLSRYNPDGSLDSTFGSGGVIRYPITQLLSDIQPLFGKVLTIGNRFIDNEIVLTKIYTDIDAILSVDENKIDLTDNLIIYPNPVLKELNISFSESYPEITIILLDLKGRKILESEFFFDQHLTIDLDNLSSGIYLLNVQFNDGSIHRKILK